MLQKEVSKNYHRSDFFVHQWKSNMLHYTYGRNQFDVVIILISFHKKFKKN